MASAPAWSRASWGAEPAQPVVRGYGTDPDLVRRYQAGELWPLTFTEQQRRTAAALCGLIIPADDRSPSAAQLEVHLFIDEWISAPYPGHALHRVQVTALLAWLDEQSRQRFQAAFAELDESQQREVCDDICWQEKAAREFFVPAGYFATFRDLAADGFYTTPQGMKDLGYVGNVPLAAFDGPPAEALKKAGLTR